MPGIFISYRRIDTLPWAAHLFADLKRSFGESLVFMDVHGIPRGSKFAQVLTEALAGCDTLLALIGPQWASCQRSDGTRRLDAPDDWVRNEIATALRRKIPVMPVMFGAAELPEELPEDLRALSECQKAVVTDAQWDYEVGGLIKDLTRITLLTLVDDVTSANTGIRLLKDLITEEPMVADAVGRSKEVIENTYRQVGKLELFKLIHDALHTIELECLGPMKAGGAANRLRPYRVRFAGAQHRIQEAIQGAEMNPLLRDDLVDRLDSAAAAFQTAVDAPDEAAFGRIVSELNGLIGSIPAQLDLGIADASTGLRLDRLLELMSRVRETLPATAAEKGSELEPFVQGIDALDRLKEELARRTAEHGQLQRLDSKLRVVCVGGTLPGLLAGEWSRIKMTRSRLSPPFSPELEAVNDDLVAIELEIEAALGHGEASAALDLVREYFRAVSTVFRDVDSRLKEFCLRLGTVSQPLQTILAMC